MAELDAIVEAAARAGYNHDHDHLLRLTETEPSGRDWWAEARRPGPQLARAKATAILAAVAPLIRAQLAAELSEALLAKRDRLRVQFGGGNPRQAGRQGGLEEAANIVRRHVTAPEVSGG